jgi:hypothetical protein
MDTPPLPPPKWVLLPAGQKISITAGTRVTTYTLAQPTQVLVDPRITTTQPPVQLP